MSVYRDHLERYLKSLDVKADRVIDVAGGSNPVSKRVRSWDVNNYVVLDNELERQQTKIDVHFDMNESLMDSMTDALKESFTKFDIVFCLELFDYIWNPVQACQNLRLLCKDDGRLIITFPFVYPNHNPVAFDMLRFTKQGATKLLRHAGFVIDEVIPRGMNHTAYWMDLMQMDGYKYRGAQEAGTLFDAGYIIEAHTK